MAAALTIESAQLDELLEALRRRGHTVIGPVVRDGAIVYDELDSAADLPRGLTDEQEPGHYRLRRRDDEALFGFAVGPHSLKRFQLPADRLIFSARLGRSGELDDIVVDSEPPRIAVLGVRSCELHARRILERVLLGGSRPDPIERAASERLFLVAVQCAEPAGTCFCASMGTGPEVTDGHDIVLTEILRTPAGDPVHRFVLQAGSERGAEVLADLNSRPATDAEERAAREVPRQAAAQMGRELVTDGLRELLYRSYDDPRWDEVAERCVTCGNCTMVCPTCFCTTVEDVSDLAGERLERHQRWDSCFTVDYSFIHGGSVRNTARSRYRQWLTHKLATWSDQFGTAGCVGCGRCIAWCPVGIDITEEAAAIRTNDEQAAARRGEEANHADA
jgi:ferredoxin